MWLMVTKNGNINPNYYIKEESYMLGFLSLGNKSNVGLIVIRADF